MPALLEARHDDCAHYGPHNTEVIRDGFLYNVLALLSQANAQSAVGNPLTAKIVLFPTYPSNYCLRVSLNSDRRILLTLTHRSCQFGIFATCNRG